MAALVFLERDARITHLVGRVTDQPIGGMQSDDVTFQYLFRSLGTLSLSRERKQDGGVSSNFTAGVRTFWLFFVLKL